jgi:hypothetical protein
VAQQHRISVIYDGAVMGVYTADLSIENRVLLDMNDLAATGLPSRLLLNFGRPRLERRRLVRRPAKTESMMLGISGIQSPATPFIPLIPCIPSTIAKKTVCHDS